MPKGELFVWGKSIKSRSPYRLCVRGSEHFLRGRGLGRRRRCHPNPAFPPQPRRRPRKAPVQPHHPPACCAPCTPAECSLEPDQVYDDLAVAGGRARSGQKQGFKGGPPRATGLPPQDGGEMTIFIRVWIFGWVFQRVVPPLPRQPQTLGGPLYLPLPRPRHPYPYCCCLLLNLPPHSPNPQRNPWVPRKDEGSPRNWSSPPHLGG